MKHLLIALLLFAGTAQTTPPMKSFVVLVSVPVTYSTEKAKAVNPEWEKAIADWKASGHYITSFAYPGDSRALGAPTTQQTMKQVSSILLRAADIDQAVVLAQACPILKYGGSVEIREIPKGEPEIFVPLQ